MSPEYVRDDSLLSTWLGLLTTPIRLTQSETTSASKPTSDAGRESKKGPKDDVSRYGSVCLSQPLSQSVSKGKGVSQKTEGEAGAVVPPDAKRAPDTTPTLSPVPLIKCISDAPSLFVYGNVTNLRSKDTLGTLYVDEITLLPRYDSTVDEALGHLSSGRKIRRVKVATTSRHSSIMAILRRLYVRECMAEVKKNASTLSLSQTHITNPKGVFKDPRARASFRKGSPSLNAVLDLANVLDLVTPVTFKYVVNSIRQLGKAHNDSFVRSEMGAELFSICNRRPGVDRRRQRVGEEGGMVVDMEEREREEEEERAELEATFGTNNILKATIRELVRPAEGPVALLTWGTVANEIGALLCDRESQTGLVGTDGALENTVNQVSDIASRPSMVTDMTQAIGRAWKQSLFQGDVNETVVRERESDRDPDRPRNPHALNHQIAILPTWSGNSKLYLYQELLSLRPSRVVMLAPSLHAVRAVERLSSQDIPDLEVVYIQASDAGPALEKSSIDLVNETAAFVHLSHPRKMGRERGTRRMNLQQDNTDVHVIIDSREMNSSLPTHLYALNTTISIRTLEIGDYIVNSACVERKTCADLVSSFMSGRLAKQVKQMIDTFEHCIILVEEPRSSEPSIIMPSSAQQASFVSRFTAFLQKYPVKVLWTEPGIPAAEMLLQLAKRHPFGTLTDGQSASVLDRVHGQLSSIDPSIARALDLVPGLADHDRQGIRQFGSLAEVIASDPTVLADTLGDKTAETISDFFSSAIEIPVSVRETMYSKTARGK
ncbi:hypothetical protein KIPB_005738 [Kipferlia bialata]|uniref:ERCC4 domain-containing protein n=1 Tax=Kipferlia bialata TaxID=797122 RepID=A0A9K3CRF6_9EUKA|nr:hypothetical protein KIPB_002951 [Kipferlia bialata]GIQ84278.1 hypothetical protein KIPB_005738 [Kipferlia bialata]|eukprot:g2951.t1